MEQKDFTAGKQGYLVQVTDEQLAMGFQVFPVRILSAEDLEAARKLRRSEDLAYCAGVQARLTQAAPALQPVIAHHRHDEDGRSCLGCDAGSYAEDSPEWPCSTIELILEGLPTGPPLASCPTRLMDGRNEIRCWLPAGHPGECK